MNVYWTIIICLAILCLTAVAMSWIGNQTPPRPRSEKTKKHDSSLN